MLELLLRCKNWNFSNIIDYYLITLVYGFEGLNRSIFRCVLEFSC